MSECGWPHFTVQITSSFFTHFSSPLFICHRKILCSCLPSDQKYGCVSITFKCTFICLICEYEKKPVSRANVTRSTDSGRIRQEKSGRHSQKLSGLLKRLLTAPLTAQTRHASPRPIKYTVQFVHWRSCCIIKFPGLCFCMVFA